ncbi:hypothetical protein I4U23_003986 [Adineta vaga]|nr:hypothetical protein I4U23_003986 [Adineta vaga]
MNPVRSSRRQPITPRSSFEQIAPMQRSLSKSSRQKTRSVELLSPLTSTSLQDFTQQIENNGEMIDSNPSQLVSDVSLRRVEFVHPPPPQNILIGPKHLDNPCFCQITMCYRSDPTLPSILHNTRRDEITIFQLTKNGLTWIVFKGFLKTSDAFTFKSQRSIDDRFHLKMEINGSLDTTISACCEHPLHRGGRIDDGDSSFWIRSIEQYTSCAKCLESIDVLSTSTDEENLAVPPSDSEESDTEEDQSVVSEKSVKNVEQPQVKPTHTEKPLTSKPEVELIVKPIPSKDKLVDDGSAVLKFVTECMQEALSKPKSSQTIPPRCIGNVENFTILHINLKENEDLNQLRPVVNFIRKTNDLNTLKTLLTTITDEKLIVVISSDQPSTILPQFQNYQFIYILSKQTQSIDISNKTIGIYQTIDSLRDHLINTLPYASFRMIPFEITSKDNTTADLSFTYSQLLKETLLCQDDESDLKKDMLTFCRLHYVDNSEELNQIDLFENSFIDSDCIRWYTRYSFLSKMLSRAFRTHEIDLLFKMRYFIQSLHKQIQTISIKESITVYVMLNFEQGMIENFRENINGLVIFRSFLPARSVKCFDKDSEKSLLFSIRLGPNCAAKIESNHQIDILINLDVIFRIISIDTNENDTHIINLESIPPNDTHFQQLTSSLRKEIEAPVVILQMSKLLLETNHYWECDYLTESIYQDKSFNEDGTLLASLAAAHHQLGNINVKQKDNEGARYQFFKSIRAFQIIVSPFSSMLSSSYNNIGSMFFQDDQNENAIEFHQMALQCQLKSSSPDMDSIAVYSTNIGAVYVDEKKYIEAIKHLKRAVTIREQMSMEEDNIKALISLLQRISSCYWQRGEAKEALNYYKKTLELQLQLPNPLPHPLSVTYYNLSTAYAQLNEYDEAVKCAEKSVEYLKTISENHPELKENQAQLEIARQKQWLKQVLSV